MAADIRDQVLQEIKSAAFCLFSIQLDESTDVAPCSQLMVFVKYVHLNSFKEELLFYYRPEKTTKAVNIFKKVSSNQKIFCGKSYVGATQMKPFVRNVRNQI